MMGVLMPLKKTRVKLTKTAPAGKVDGIKPSVLSACKKLRVGGFNGE